MKTPLSTATTIEMMSFYMYSIVIILLAILLTIVLVKPLLKSYSKQLKEFIEQDKIANIVVTLIIVDVIAIIEHNIFMNFFN